MNANDFFPDMTLPSTKVVLTNISYLPELNSIVRRDVKDLIMTAEDSSLHRFKYLKPRPCLKCQKLFHDSVDMLGHIQYNHIKMVSCPQCRKSMNNWRYQNVHRQLCKKPCKKYQCGKCGETVSSQKKLADHNLTIHTPSLQSRCVFCE